MRVPLVQVSWDGYRIQSYRPDFILCVRPEPGHPRGRKGALMADSWSALKSEGAAGIIWMDPDIVADPDDMAGMAEAITANPLAVWVARHKLWPASTGRDAWVWGYGPWEGDRPGMTQDPTVTPQWFALGLTYTPARLLDTVWADLECWEFGTIDMGLSRAAREMGIPIYVTPSCRPKHVHWTPRPDDVTYRGQE